MEANIQEYELNGIKYCYLTPPSREFSFDCLAKYIQTKDFNIIAIAVVSEHRDEADQIMRELGKRGVACLLINNKSNNMLDTIVRLWTEGFINAVLVVCDDMLSLLAKLNKVKVDLLVHFSEPLPHIFQHRIETLIRKTDKEPQVMVIRSPIAIDKLSSNSAENSPIKETHIASSLNQNKETATSPKQAVNLEENSPIMKIVPRTTNDGSSLSSTSSSDIREQITSDSQLLYKYNKYGVYAQSHYAQESCENISSIKTLNPDIKETMIKLHIGDKLAKSVQRFAWTHVAKGRSLCVIGNQQIGKTWCYLPWLCHKSIEEGQRRDTNVHSYGPNCIILCGTADKAREIKRWCDRLPCNLPAIGHFELKDALRVTEQLSKSPCGILITTVELMLPLCYTNGKDMQIFNPLAIRCVAIDDLSKMWRSRRIEIKKLFQWLFSYLRIEKDFTQLMIVGCSWIDELMDSWLPKLPDVLLLFEDALEATAFGGIKLDIRQPTSKDEFAHDIEFMMRAIKNNLKQERVVFVCAEKEDTAGIAQILWSIFIKTIIISDNNGLSTYRQFCKEHNTKVLIVTDDMIPKLRGTPISLLVHYTPAKNFHSFKMRFSLFYTNYQAQLNPNANSKKATSLIYISKSGTDLSNAWCICDFMFYHDRQVPEDWLALLSLNRIEFETSSKKPEICSQLLSYGGCWRRFCHYRHKLQNYEILHPIICPNNNNNIQFYILSVLSPAHLVVKMTTFQINTHFYGIPVTELGKNIQVHYQEPNNRRQHLEPKLDDICIAKYDNLYQRVVVKYADSNIIHAKQIDAGTGVIKVKPLDLWICEEHFSKHPFEATELRIAGLKPCNMECIWPEIVKNLVRNSVQIARGGKPLRVYTANVEFDFNDVRFVNNVYDEDNNNIKTLLVNNLRVRMDDNVLLNLKGLLRDHV